MTGRHSVRLALLAAALLLTFASTNAKTPGVAAPRILIRSGEVIDGTGTPARRADVRVEGDTIVEVGPNLRPREGETVLEASGQVVAPGFIDMHSHLDGGIGQHPDAEAAVRQGITTTVVGNCGSSPLPVSDFFETLASRPPAINVLTLVGHGTVRSLVLGGDYKRAATPAEIDTMKALVDRAMQDGAIGLSSGLEYFPGFYAATDELVALASVAGKYGGFYASHVRDEAREVFAAWREAIEIGRKAGVPVEISHIKLGVVPVWGRTSEALKLLEDARRDGVQVTADWYPYTYWHSSIYVLLPDRQFENRKSWEQALADNGGPQSVIITSYEPDRSLEGKSIADIAQAWSKDAVTTILDMIRAGGLEIGVIGVSMDEGDLVKFVAHPQVLIGSDGSLSGRHPRNYGAFPRVLARYVREQKVLSLSEGIAKMSGRSAAKLGLIDRGIVAAGTKADLVVFDPAAIADRGTPQDPSQAPVGIRYVIVNGQVAVDDGKLTGARSGRGLRRMAGRAGS
jgi:N-acyl-D-amino-acid deacylase